MKNRIRLLTVVVGALALFALPAAAQAASPTLVSGPPALTNSGSVSISAEFPAATAYTCALDGGTPAACVMPATFTGLAEGSHTVTVTAAYLGSMPMCIPMPPGPDMCFDMPAPMTTDALEVKFSVDLTAPVATMVNGANDRSASKSANATFVFSSDAGTTFACTMDGLTVAGCASPLKFKKLKTGVHKLSITPTDAAGNVGTPLTRVFAVNSKTKTFKFVGNKVKRCVKKKKGKRVCKKLNF
ncbi:MAG: hypothetical protein ACRDKE_04040 [Solirubrobacterales bacterium]